MKKTTRTKEEVTTAIIDYFKENEDVFDDCIEKLDTYNGYLGDNRYYCMDDLDDLAMHFDIWLEKYAFTPDRMAEEFKMFASIR